MEKVKTHKTKKIKRASDKTVKEVKKQATKEKKIEDDEKKTEFNDEELDEIFNDILKAKKAKREKEEKEAKVKKAIEKEKGRKYTDDGLPIYTEEELGMNNPKAGTTPLCPFDCDCCH